MGEEQSLLTYGPSYFSLYDRSRTHRKNSLFYLTYIVQLQRKINIIIIINKWENIMRIHGRIKIETIKYMSA